MIVIISPAKRLDFERRASHRQSTPQFHKDANHLVAQLQKLSAEDLQQLMTISEKIADLNVSRFASWQRHADSKRAKQALFAFRGDVYLGLDADTLSTADLDFAQHHLRILSGLYGVLKPLDAIQAHRLEMGTPLKNKHGDKLYDFWGTRITQSLNDELAAMSDSVLINLASNEYFAAIVPAQLNAPIITPLFKERRNGSYKVISFNAKRARGMMARAIIQERITDPELLKQLSCGDYRYRASMSNETQWIFARR